MALQACDAHRYEPRIGIVMFEMLDGPDVVYCMVSECALRNRAMTDGAQEETAEALFQRYGGEVAAIAAQQYRNGINNPMLRSIDLVPPQPLPTH